MEGGGGRRAAAAVAVVVVALGSAVGCGSEPDPGAASTSAGEVLVDPWPAERLPAQPIAVDGVPDGWVLEIAERATHEPFLSDDYGGTIEPSLLAVPEGWDGDVDAVVAVGAVDYSGLQGGFGQAVGGCVEYAVVEMTCFELDGRPAVHSETTERTDVEDWQRSLHWGQVSVDLGDLDGRREEGWNDPGWAIRASSPTAGRDVLTDFASAATLDDRRLPVLDPVPEGWQVISSVTATQIDAADAFVARDPMWGTVEVDGYVLGWREPGADGLTSPSEHTHLTVTSVEGSADDLAAIAALRGQTSNGGYTPAEIQRIEAVDLDGREAWLSVGDHDVAVAVALDGGGVAVVDVVADGPFEGDDGDRWTALALEVAAGVRPIDDAAWEAQLASLLGGEGLQPDPGAPVLVRGLVDGRGWLLQASWVTPLDLHGGARGPGPAYCVKLEGDARVCSGSVHGGTTAARGVYDRDAASYEPGDADADRPTFVVGHTVAEVARVQVTVDGTTLTVDTVPVPGADTRAWIVPGQTVGDVVLLDAVGNPVAP